MLLLLPVIKSLPIKLKVSRQNHFRVDSRNLPLYKGKERVFEIQREPGRKPHENNRGEGTAEIALRGLLMP